MDAAALPQRIDFARLSGVLYNNKRDIREALEGFLKFAHDIIRIMETAEKTNDAAVWLAMAQRLKNGSTRATAKRLAGLCSEAEAITAFPHPQSPAVLYHLNKELSLLRVSVHEYLHGVPY